MRLPAWRGPFRWSLDSGGLDGYLRALGTQAGEDFAWVNMLWLEPTPRRLAFALYETFVLPWGSVALAMAVAVCAAAGLVALAVRDRAGLAVMLLAFGPYAAFHLLFQETITVRYSLPTLPLVAWLAAGGFSARSTVRAAGGRPGSWPRHWSCRCRWGSRSARRRTRNSWPLPLPESGRGRRRRPRCSRTTACGARSRPTRPACRSSSRAASTEWLGPVEYWKGGGTGPVWFLADPRRTDLALIDPLALQDVTRFPWAVAGRPELGGSRPLGADWYRIAAPGWFAGEGWALTPETGGLAQASAAGPDHRPIEAWVRRRPGPLHLVVGGRHLGEPGDPAADFELSLDGVVRDRWTLDGRRA